MHVRLKNATFCKLRVVRYGPLHAIHGSDIWAQARYGLAPESTSLATGLKGSSSQRWAIQAAAGNQLDNQT